MGRDRNRDPPQQPAEPVDERPSPSLRSLRGLDWFIFFLADVQTGFGPFVAVYLTTQKWTQVEIGLVLSVSGLVALVGQMPGGAVVDAVRSVRFVAGLAVAAIGVAALAYAVLPTFLVVMMAAVLHASASCVLGPAIAAMSLGLVGQAAVGERFGRNARFASIGSGIAAAVMGACGYFLSSRAVFLVTVALAIPTLFALAQIRAGEIDPERTHGAAPRGKDLPSRKSSTTGIIGLLRNRPLLTFAGCVLLFQLANAAMLPIMAGVVTMRSSNWATVLIAACIIVPQVVVAAMSPWVGRKAQQWGRRPLLLIGFAALPIRGLLFATVTDPYVLVVIQMLDGITAAVFAVMVPLTIADVTLGTGRFSLAQGMVGTATGIGASISTVLAGYISDHHGSSMAFFALATVAAVGLTSVYALMPETRRDDRRPSPNPLPAGSRG
ncbi:MFS transporter [Roseiarcaceae bacterium H3SJ34-1]|uniref:MFS transporter n=1 Tax=Terripilifer ovatus TaxID=3032367 RepID=UPI003AB9B64F|nr:MFS transporter [Roseiarcaceae bacterium H3SJ34-1]